MQIAQSLPWPTSAAVARAVREAFASSLRSTCGLAAIVAVALSVAAVLFLEGVNPEVAAVEQR